MSSEENNLEQLSPSLSYSLCSQSCTLIPVSSKPGTIKLSASVGDCSCAKGTASEFPKLCKITCYPKPVTRPIPAVSVTPSIELCNCEHMTEPSVPACESEEEGTHEHKCCATPCCEHNSQGIQPSSSYSDSCNSSHSSPVISNIDKPHIEPRLKEHVPRSVEELKASITGLTGFEKKLPPGNLLGCEYIEYRCEIGCPTSCSPTDSQVSVASCPAPKNGFTLTIEPKDHRFCNNPNECIHSREFCPPEPCPPSPPRPLLPPPAFLPFPPGPARKPKPPKCPPQPPPPALPPPPPPACPPPHPPACPPLPPPETPPPPTPECPPPPPPECPPLPPPDCPPPPPPSLCPPPPPPECPPPSTPDCPPPPPPECPPPPPRECPPPPKVCPEPPTCPPNPCPAPPKKPACSKCRRPPSPPIPLLCPTSAKLQSGNCPGGCDQCNRHRD